MTNLENVRKQARQLVRWHREHNYDVASRIRAALPQFHELSDQLGFTVVFTYGDPPYYGQVRRDHVGLNLRHVDDPVFNGTVREDDQLLAASVTVENVKALYSEYVVAEVDFQQTLRRQPWGAHQFVVRDPDGSLILFGGP